MTGQALASAKVTRLKAKAIVTAGRATAKSHLRGAGAAARAGEGLATAG